MRGGGGAGGARAGARAGARGAAQAPSGRRESPASPPSVDEFGASRQSRRARSTAELRGRREACAGTSEAGATREVAAGYTHRNTHRHAGTEGQEIKQTNKNQASAAPTGAELH